MWIMLWNCRCTCVFSVFMVSSLVATSRNSLCIFVTLSCEGLPRAVATVLGCLCELFSKRKPVTLLQPKRAPCLSRHLSSMVVMRRPRCYVVKAVLGVIFHNAETAKGSTYVSFSQVTDMKNNVHSEQASKVRTQRRIPTPQGRHKHLPLSRSKQLAPSNGYHSNSDYTRPAVNHHTNTT